MDLMLSCRKATELMVAREDRPLTLGERLSLRVHLAICKSCPRFDRQMRSMRHALDTWAQYRDEPDTPEQDDTPRQP